MKRLLSEITEKEDLASSVYRMKSRQRENEFSDDETFENEVPLYGSLPPIPRSAAEVEFKLGLNIKMKQIE